MDKLQNFERQVTHSEQGGLCIAYVLKRDTRVRVFAARGAVGIHPGGFIYSPEDWIAARKHPRFGQLMGFTDADLKELAGLWPDFHLACKRMKLASR